MTKKEIEKALIAWGWVKNERGLWIDPARKINAMDAFAAFSLQARRVENPTAQAIG